MKKNKDFSIHYLIIIIGLFSGVAGSVSAIPFISYKSINDFITYIIVSMFIGGFAGLISALMIDKFIIKPGKYAENIINSMYNGDFTVFADKSKGWLPVTLSDLSFRFSKIISKMKSLNNLTINELTHYKNAIGGISHAVNAQNEFSLEVINTMDKFKNLNADINTKTNELEDVSEDAAASSEEMSLASKNIAGNIGNLSVAIEEVSAIVEETSSSIQNITENTQELLILTEETSTSMVQLSADAKLSVSDAQETANVAKQMKIDAQEGNQSVQETVNGITDLREIAMNTSYVIENLGKNTQKIGEIVNVIREIADQTNHLQIY